MEEPVSRDAEDCGSDPDQDQDRNGPKDESHRDSVRKGSDRSQLQRLRAKINLQINRELRLRAGAENLLRASSNSKVRQTVFLELSFVNSNLQLLKEELEELNSSMEAYQTPSESVNVPMIPLGLKETKEVDFSLCIKDFISEHYGEDSSEFEPEIRELHQLRQAMRTPSRNQAGLELLMKYYNQLYYVDQRFCKPQSHLGALFHWYDSLTGVPSCQKALAFEKGSVVFNIGALYTQIGARQDRSVMEGIDRAIDAFQRAAGAFGYLKENFCNAPSLDMSCPALCMLLRLMMAQAQECVLERTTLRHEQETGPERTTKHCSSLLRLAQEAARVAEVYGLVLQSMQTPLMKDYVPFSWSSMVQVKLQHFTALSHFYSALALSLYADEDEDALLQFYSHCPSAAAISLLLRHSESRRRLCKSHLRSAVMCHEEALRLHSLCKVLRRMDLLQDVLSAAHRCSLHKYSQLDREDDFDETAEAPDVHPHSEHKPDLIPPDFSSVQVSDIFHKLGPLCVFGARSHWGPLRTVLLPRSREGGLGLTLRGDAPVLVAAVVPGGPAQEAGLREGDYIVAVNGVDTKWSKHRDVVQFLQNSSNQGSTLSVVTLHSTHLPQVERRAVPPLRPGAEGSGRGQVVKASLLNWSRKKKHNKRPEVDSTQELY